MRYTLKGIGATIAALWGGFNPIMQALLVLIVLDIITGILAGYYTRTLSSEKTFRGMAKKTIVLAIVAGAHVLSAAWQSPIPLGTAAAGFYVIHEMLSIMENAGRAGIPLPQQLMTALQKLQSK